MRKEIIEINVQTDKAQKNVKNLEKSLNETSQSTADLTGELDNITGGSISKLKGLKGTLKTVTNSFKSLRVAVISTGIGALVIGVIALIQAFKRSEEGQNKMAKLLNVIGTVTGKLLDYVADLGEYLIAAFENPQQALKDFAKLIKDNIVNRFEGLVELIPNLGKAINLLFKGEFKEAGKVALDSVTKVSLGIENVTDKVSGMVETIAKDIKTAGEGAARVTDLIVKAERKERELITERAEANRKIAELREKAAQKDKFSAEERIKFLEEAGKVEERVTNKEIDAAALRLEAKKLENSLTKSTKEDLEAEEQAKAKLIELETSRLNLQKRLTTELITTRREASAEADADVKKEQERLKSVEDYRKQLQREKEDFEAKTQEEKLILEEERKIAELENLALTETEKQELILSIQQLYQGKKDELKQAELDKEKQDAQAKIDLEKNVANAKTQQAYAVSNIIRKIAGEDSKVGKAIAIGQATISGIQATVNAFKSAQDSPITTVFPAYPFIQAGISAGFTAAQIKQLTSTSPVGGGGSLPKVSSSGGGSAVAASRPQAPKFNIVGQTGTNQLAQTIEGQNKRPIKTYVTSDDVTTNQALDRSIEDSATI